MTLLEELLGESFPEQVRALAGGELAWVVFSGRAYSGKDTVADRLQLPGGFKKISYGDLLREQVSAPLEEFREGTALGGDPAELARQLARGLGVSAEAGGEAAALLTEDLRAHPELTPWSRTHAMRTVLQKLGGAWTRSDHLPRLAARAAMETLAGGESVVSAGSRYPLDAEVPRSVGALLVRLEVSPATQVLRMKLRDGLEATPGALAALGDPGEVALDSYQHFFFKTENDSQAAGSLEAVAAAVQEAVAGALRERRGAQ